VGDLATDNAGAFVYQTPALADGTHEFQAICADDEALVSEKVRIEIDRTPPTVMSVEINPDRALKPGEIFSVTVGSSESLAGAWCIFQDVLTPLEPAFNKFSGAILAPTECGEYPLNCTISDLLGNELEEPQAAMIKVCADEPAEVPEVSIEVPPTAVSNLFGQSEEGQVTLFWSPAEDDNEVSRYRVNFGTCGESLNGLNVTPDNRTQWYIDGLESCQKYCFAVTAVDNEGLESVMSNEVEGTPLCPDPLHSAPTTPQSGPGDDVEITNTMNLPVWILALMAGVGVLLMVRRRV
jgi:hypothetical protein